MAKDKTDVLNFASAGNNAVDLINRVDVATQKFQPGARRGSIIKAAQNNLFEFPVFISNTIPMDYATATNSLLEQIYAAYLQMAISQNPVIDAKSVKNGLQFADLKTDVNKYLEYTECDWQHEACHNIIQEDGIQYEFNMLSIEDKDARVINECYDYQPLSEFSHFFQEAPGDDITAHMDRVPLPETYPGTNTPYIPWRFRQDTDGNIIYGTRTQVADILRGSEIPVPNGKGGTTMTPAFNAYSTYVKSNSLAAPSIATINNANRAAGPEPPEPEVPKEEAPWERFSNSTLGTANRIAHGAVGTVDSLAKTTSDVTSAIHNVATLKDRIQKAKLDNEKLREDIAQAPLKRSEINQKLQVKAPMYVDDSKCAKLNTMKPLLMSVAVNMLNKDDTLQPLNFVIGVKTHLRVVPSDILPEVALYPLKEMDKVSRKVKWRAGELKFLKDIIFRINEKKQTAADARDPKRKWYRRLYELAHMKGDAPAAAVVQGKSLFASFIRDKQGKGKMMHGMIPNASIIMSKDNVDNIKAKTKIDLLKGSTAKKFCGELFLMSLIIIDADAESVKIMLPDINDDFDVHSIASINKQLATLDTAGTKTRDIFKMLG